jgi:hypothetical protein
MSLLAPIAAGGGRGWGIGEEVGAVLLCEGLCCLAGPYCEWMVRDCVSRPGLGVNGWTGERGPLATDDGMVRNRESAN